MNNIKFTNEVLSKIYEQLALGNSIKTVLKELNLSWEGFRLLMHKKPKIRTEYEQAKADGVNYLLDNGVDSLKKAIEDIKAEPNQKNGLAITHLQKEIIGLLRFKASHLLPKYNQKAQQIALSNANDKPLIIKWSKD